MATSSETTVTQALTIKRSSRTDCVRILIETENKIKQLSDDVRMKDLNEHERKLVTAELETARSSVNKMRGELDSKVDVTLPEVDSILYNLQNVEKLFSVSARLAWFKKMLDEESKEINDRFRSDVLPTVCYERTKELLIDLLRHDENTTRESIQEAIAAKENWLLLWYKNYNVLRLTMTHAFNLYSDKRWERDNTVLFAPKKLENSYKVMCNFFEHGKGGGNIKDPHNLVVFILEKWLNEDPIKGLNAFNRLVPDYKVWEGTIDKDKENLRKVMKSLNELFNERSSIERDIASFLTELKAQSNRYKGKFKGLS